MVSVIRTVSRSEERFLIRRLLGSRMLSHLPFCGTTWTATLRTFFCANAFKTEVSSFHWYDKWCAVRSVTTWAVMRLTSAWSTLVSSNQIQNGQWKAKPIFTHFESSQTNQLMFWGLPPLEKSSKTSRMVLVGLLSHWLLEVPMFESAAILYKHYTGCINFQIKIVAIYLIKTNHFF